MVRAHTLSTLCGNRLNILVAKSKSRVKDVDRYCDQTHTRRLTGNKLLLAVVATAVLKTALLLLSKKTRCAPAAGHRLYAKIFVNTIAYQLIIWLRVMSQQASINILEGGRMELLTMLVSLYFLSPPAQDIKQHSPTNVFSAVLTCLVPNHIHESWSGDLPFVCADDVAVRRQEVRGGCWPPRRCSGTVGVRICTLSQPSL